MRISRKCITSVAFAAAMLSVGAASAQEGKDGVRFRGGVDLTGGALLVSNFGVFLAGVDGRVGVQINDLIGVYVQPHLSLGGGKVLDVPVFTGVFGTSGVVDFTFADRGFAGIGGGFAYIGSIPNPFPQIHFRGGGYPLVSDGADGIRRKGLMVGADVHLYFVSTGVESVTVLQPMILIGYEAF